MSVEEIEVESREDPWLGEVRQAITTENWESLSSTRVKAIKDELCTYNNIVLRGTRIVVPEKLKKRVLSIALEEHPGIVAMKDRLRSKVGGQESIKKIN
ncbi:hypothetical protein RF55_24049 [Lasius niger]|uniref:Uncharacterized protein n=1 Tax=Lasius niger TaxID=67767 RepID=A0A0J7MNG6_LASNI|nr:hypothetical protein RF55_24049 [Lasius niger]